MTDTPADRTIATTISGGHIQGVAGAGSVVIENFTIYNRGPDEQTAAEAADGPIAECPYPGLAYFGPNDTHLFFGRDAAISRLAEAVDRRSLTVLAGASGGGKSSVVLAGLAPRLNAAGNWRFSHFRIGAELDSNPFLALARALAPLYVASDSDVERLRNTKLLAKSLENGELTLRDIFADCRSRNKGRRILLIADQFEEAFTLVADEAVRSSFIDVLLAGFPDPPPGSVPDICLVLTLRADFYGRALRHRPLADAMQNHVENLGPMNREELQEAIVRPAKDVGVTFESGLVDTLLDTVRSQAGGLPLLQFALREMWVRQERKTLTRKSYDEIGGVGGALAQRAETVFAGLTQNGADTSMDKAFQRLFTRLVTLGEGQEDTRRVVERGELGDSDWVLAQRLADEQNRLVVTNASSVRETAEVVHEALIRHWPKLVDWVNRDRAFHLWLRQIRSNIEVWSANPDDDGTLLRGGMLAQAIDWLARRRDDLSPTELAYIEASVELRRKAEAEKEAARQAELKREQDARDQARRRQRQAAVAAVFFGALAIAAAVAGVLAIQERNQAKANFALAREAADSLVTDIADLRHETGISAKVVQKVLENAKGTIEHLADRARNDRDLQQSRARMLHEFGGTYNALGQIEDAIKAFRDSIAIRQRLAASDPDDSDLRLDMAISYNSLATIISDQGNFDEALKLYREALGLRAPLAAAAPDDPVRQRAVSSAYNNIADVLMKQGNFDEALRSLEQARAINERLVAADAGNDSAQRGLSFNYENIGYVLMMQGKLDEALRLSRDALAIRERRLVAKPNDARRQHEVGTANDAVGDVLVRQAKLDEALKVFRDGLAVRERLAAADASNISVQRDLGLSYDKIGGALARQGKLAEARELFLKGLAIGQRLSTVDRANRQWRKDLHDRVGEVAALAYRLVLAGEFAQALEVEDQAIALAPDMVWLYETRAYALMLLDRGDEARALYLQYRGREARAGKPWEGDILAGFADLRTKGLAHPLMSEIAAQLAAGGGADQPTQLPVAHR